MIPVILVGRRPDGGWRDVLWSHCAHHWKQGLGWPISVGYELGPGPFCLAVASNRAIASAGDWTVAFYVGADVLVDARQAVAAVVAAEQTGQLVFAHDHYYSLSEEGTNRVLAGEPAHGGMSEWPPWPNTFSSCLAVPRHLWEQVGGFDERFVGWGFEDLAFWSACCALAGNFGRLTGPVYHLWHERDSATREASPTHADNETLGRRYLAAKSNRAAMLEILAERHPPDRVS